MNSFMDNLIYAPSYELCTNKNLTITKIVKIFIGYVERNPREMNSFCTKMVIA